MKWEPKDYQIEALTWLLQRPHAGLFLDMGLGKTSICLAAISELRRRGLVKKTLVIAPMRVCYSVWPAERDKWDDFDHLTVTNWHKYPGAAPGDITVVNPERVAGLAASLSLRQFDHIIFDESSLWKAHDSKRFKAMKSEIGRIGRRWILTGTPAPNSLMDVWAQIYLLDLGASLGRFITHFRNAFCKLDFTGFNWSLVPGATDEIYSRIKPLVLRMDAKDHLDMPDLIVNPVVVDLPPAARETYDQFERDFFTVINEQDIEAPTAAVLGMRLRQIANGGIYSSAGAEVVHDEKVSALKELVDTLGKPLLCFYEFKHDVERIRPAFKDEIINLSDCKDPDKVIADFNAGKIKLLMAHAGSAGYGNNLQGSCSNIAFFGLPWSLGNYLQAIARVWRQGQQSAVVTIHHIIARHTRDERVSAALAVKDATQSALMKALAAK